MRAGRWWVWGFGGWCALLQAAPAAPVGPAHPVLPPPVQQALADLAVPDTALSVLVMPKAGGPVRLAWAADVPRVPASTMKTVATLVALEQLGPVHRWRTDFLAEQPPADGVLRGPLYVRGDGDPDFPYERLHAALRELRQQGVHTLAGDLVLDRRAFQPARPELGAPAFDESPEVYYNVIPDALLLHGNMVFLSLRSTQQGLQVRTSPPMHGLQVDVSGLALRDGDCGGWGETWQAPLVEETASAIVLRLRGSFPRDCNAEAQTNAVERNRYWGAVLRALWAELGGRWEGQVRDGAVPPGASVLVARRSDTLADIVKRVNKPSDNAMARLLYLTLGAQALQGREGDTREAAQAVVRDWFQRHGITTDGLVVDNGSGLSRSERLSARQLALLLRAGAASDWAPEFETSLPIAGVDGTMRRRLRETPAAVRARVKTGTLADAVGVAGYVRDLARQEWIVVALLNDPIGARGRPVLDALLQWVVQQPLRPLP